MMRLDKMLSLTSLATVLSLLLFTIPSCRGADDDNNDDMAGYLAVTACDWSRVEVNKVTLLCDSPGEYYYGSSAYRKSETCMFGDKINLKLDFTINQASSDANDDANADGDDAGNNANDDDLAAYTYMTLSNLGVEVAHPISQTDICNIDGVTSYYGNECPSPGMYYINLQFWLYDESGQYGDDDDSSFVPDVKIEFSSSGKKGEHDLGYADTAENDECYVEEEDEEDDSAEWWSSSSSGDGGQFFEDNLLLIITIAVMAMFAFFMLWQSKKDDRMKENQENLVKNADGVAA